MENKMLYKVIASSNGTMICQEFDLKTLLSKYQSNGTHFNHRTCKELQGQPKLLGFVGPMWDGDCVRYEDVSSNHHLSI